MCVCVCVHVRMFTRFHVHCARRQAYVGMCVCMRACLIACLTYPQLSNRDFREMHISWRLKPCNPARLSLAIYLENVLALKMLCIT